MVITGLGPNFCNIVEDMYVNASYRLKVGHRLGTSFSTNVGLRQGDPLSPLLFNLFIADIVFAFTTGCSAPLIQDPRSAPCYLGVSLSDNKAEQNSVMLQKASWASYSTVAAKVVNKLYEQLIEPILLYAVEQWLPYIHPRMVDKSGPVETCASPSSQLSTEDTLKKFIYPHYNLNASTPVLAVRAELGQYPTFVSGISCLASYMSYISQDTAPPLIRKAVYAQRVMATKSKYNWSNFWRIFNHFKVQESDPADPPHVSSKKKYVPNIDAGGYANLPTPITPPSSALSVFSRPLLVLPRTWILAHTTFDLPSSASAARTIDSILS